MQTVMFQTKNCTYIFQGFDENFIDVVFLQAQELVMPYYQCQHHYNGVCFWCV